MTDCELYSLCSCLWRRIRFRISNVSIASQEWEDIRAAAIHHVFEKLPQFDKNRSIRPWAFQVMWRYTINSLRRVIPNKKIQEHIWRTHFQRAKSIVIKVSQANQWGEYRTVIEPDIIDSSSYDKPIERDLDHFIQTLESYERGILKDIIDGESIRSIAQKRNLSPHRIYHRLKKIRKEYKRWEAENL